MCGSASRKLQLSSAPNRGAALLPTNMAKSILVIACPVLWLAALVPELLSAPRRSTPRQSEQVAGSTQLAAAAGTQSGSATANRSCQG